MFTFITYWFDFFHYYSIVSLRFWHWVYILTYSMVQIPSSVANWFAATQKFPRISRNPKVHYRTHKRPQPVPILGQPNPFHIRTGFIYEACSECKYRFVVKKNRVIFRIKFYCYQILHSSNHFSTYSPPLLRHLS